MIASFRYEVAFKIILYKIYFYYTYFVFRQTAIDFADLSQCKYCYKDFDNAISMEVHLDNTHLIKVGV